MMVPMGNSRFAAGSIATNANIRKSAQVRFFHSRTTASDAAAAAVRPARQSCGVARNSAISRVGIVEEEMPGPKDNPEIPAQYGHRCKPAGPEARAHDGVVHKRNRHGLGRRHHGSLVQQQQDGDKHGEQAQCRVHTVPLFLPIQRLVQAQHSQQRHPAFLGKHRQHGSRKQAAQPRQPPSAARTGALQIEPEAAEDAHARKQVGAAHDVGYRFGQDRMDRP